MPSPISAVKSEEMPSPISNADEDDGDELLSSFELNSIRGGDSEGIPDVPEEGAAEENEVEEDERRGWRPPMKKLPCRWDGEVG